MNEYTLDAKRQTKKRLTSQICNFLRERLRFQPRLYICTGLNLHCSSPVTGSFRYVATSCSSNMASSTFEPYAEYSSSISIVTFCFYGFCSSHSVFMGFVRHIVFMGFVRHILFYGFCSSHTVLWVLFVTVCFMGFVPHILFYGVCSSHSVLWVFSVTFCFYGFCSSHSVLWVLFVTFCFYGFCSSHSVFMSFVRHILFLWVLFVTFCFYRLCVKDKMMVIQHYSG